MKKIKKHMEKLRKELNNLADDFEDCDRNKLLEVSRELDKIICKYIKEEQD